MIISCRGNEEMRLRTPHARESCCLSALSPEERDTPLSRFCIQSYYFFPDKYQYCPKKITGIKRMRLLGNATPQALFLRHVYSSPTCSGGGVNGSSSHFSSSIFVNVFSQSDTTRLASPHSSTRFYARGHLPPHRSVGHIA